MSVSKAIIPLLKDEVAESLLKTIQCSKLIPYTDQERKEDEQRILEFFAMRKKAKNVI